MPRRSRLCVAHTPLHVIQRGNNRVACFLEKGDREEYLWLLHEAATRMRCKLHAYVLMTNHVHLLLTPGEDHAASDLMKFLGERYVPRFNARHGRTGTLWEGRFKSHLVGSDDYLLACQRYIELNPVRAGMVTDPREFAWSSCRTMAEGLPSLLLSPSAAFEALGTTSEARQAAYRGLLAEALADDVVRRIRRCINGGFAFGSREFVKRMEKAIGRRVTEGKPGRPRNGEDPPSLQLALG